MPEQDYQQRVWVNVGDEDAWALALVEEKFGGSVYLKRQGAVPKGAKEQIVLSEQEFAALSVATDFIDQNLVMLGELDEGKIGTETIMGAVRLGEILPSHDLASASGGSMGAGPPDVATCEC